MSSKKEKLQILAVAIKANEVRISGLKEQMSEHCRDNRDNLEKMAEKIGKTTDGLVEVRGSQNLIAQEVKDLIMLRNSLNSKLWKTTLGLVIFAIIFAIIQNGESVTKIFGIITKAGS